MCKSLFIQLYIAKVRYGTDRIRIRSKFSGSATLASTVEKKGTDLKGAAADGALVLVGPGVEEGGAADDPVRLLPAHQPPVRNFSHLGSATHQQRHPRTLRNKIERRR